MLQYKIKRAVLALLAGLMLVIGLAFLTSAAWIILSEMFDTGTAALIIGLTYSGLGLVIFACLAIAKMMRPKLHTAPKPSSNASIAATLIPAFIGGLEAGIRARRQGPQRPQT